MLLKGFEGNEFLYNYSDELLRCFFSFVNGILKKNDATNIIICHCDTKLGKIPVTFCMIFDALLKEAKS